MLWLLPCPLILDLGGPRVAVDESVVEVVEAAAGAAVVVVLGVLGVGGGGLGPAGLGIGNWKPA